MFKQRLVSGIILIVIAAFALYTGGMITLAATLVISLIGYSELLRIFHIEKSSLAVIGYTGCILSRQQPFPGVLSDRIQQAAP